MWEIVSKAAERSRRISDEEVVGYFDKCSFCAMDFTRVIGIGSKEQVEAFAWETNLATEIESTGG